MATKIPTLEAISSELATALESALEGLFAERRAGVVNSELVVTLLFRSDVVRFSITLAADASRAVMVADPSVTAVTKPVFATVATLASDVVHVTAAAVIPLPSASCT